MRFKLDENFGTRTQRIFKSTGHDVQTVREESLQGASDQDLYEVCCAERWIVGVGRIRVHQTDGSEEP